MDNDLKDLKAVVLAAGKGTRLYPLTKDTPKPLVKIGDKPILEHILLNLKSQGIKDVIINLHHRPAMITDYFGDGGGLDINIRYSHEPEIMGTAGAVKKVEHELSGPFLVVYGDNYCQFDYSSLLRFHRAKKSSATVALSGSVKPTSGGIAKVDANERITSFLERPGEDQVFSRWVNAGIYLFEPSVLEFMPKSKFCDFGHDLFPQMLQSGRRIFGYKMPEVLRGINTPAEYKKAQAFYNGADQERAA